MNCLWCDEEIIVDISWSDFILLPSMKKLCVECADELEVIRGKRCSACSRLSDDEICSDCTRWRKQMNGNDAISRNHSIYAYNPVMQAMITKWKYRGDYCLGEIFREQVTKSFESAFGHLNDAVIVPIPLSQERLNDRGFNQAKMLADFLTDNVMEVFTRIHSEKQSKKTRFERITAKNPFFLNEIVEKAVILVDDIYTTGTTLRHAATLLREAGCPEVCAFTLIRG